jgi:hypothetical protein
LQQRLRLSSFTLNLLRPFRGIFADLGLEQRRVSEVRSLRLSFTKDCVPSTVAAARASNAPTFSIDEITLYLPKFRKCPYNPYRTTHNKGPS